MILEEIHQASKQVNLRQVEESVVNIDSAVIKLEELVRVLDRDLITRRQDDIVKVQQEKANIRFEEFQSVATEQNISKPVNFEHISMQAVPP